MIVDEIAFRNKIIMTAAQATRFNGAMASPKVIIKLNKIMETSILISCQDSIKSTTLTFNYLAEDFHYNLISQNFAEVPINGVIIAEFQF